MKAELEREVLAAYPDLYRNLKPRFGDGQHFECGDGWGKILKELSAGLDGDAASDGLVIIQVKQKLGALRVYFRIENREAERAESARRWINEAEEKSRWTCELCGSPGTSEWRDKGGLVTLCESCAAGDDREQSLPLPRTE
jgi:rubrerythrin